MIDPSYQVFRHFQDRTWLVLPDARPKREEAFHKMEKD